MSSNKNTKEMSIIDKSLDINTVTVKTLHSLTELHIRTKDELDNLALALSSSRIENKKLVTELKRLTKETEQIKSEYSRLLQHVKESSECGAIFDFDKFFGSTKTTVQ